MINFIVWLIFGALAGWVASILTGKNRRMGALANIVIGIFGAFVGAGILNTLGIAVPQGLSLTGFLVAVGGAVALILAARLVR
ncbi:MAG: GlsB/YeaQ/YmgE family stress response membrane protein [Chloroflexota bacterium]|nr:GlsB/YeaQ/YmgE family stress response membrane protein [Chloroflexota bacterium]MBI5702756.1 GlsB/YeaQ/YmgE family stress response membrane protein [Chloroflexota bacterium]